MSTVTEIEQAVSRLPKAEFWKFAEWFEGVKAGAWEAQMEADAKAGRLDFLFAEAAAARVAEEAKEWPAKA